MKRTTRTLLGISLATVLFTSLAGCVVYDPYPSYYYRDRYYSRPYYYHERYYYYPRYSYSSHRQWDND
jgi:hypothetical protein